MAEASRAQRTSQWLGSSLANNPSPLSKLSLNRTHSSNLRAASSFRSSAASSASSTWSCRNNDDRCRGFPASPRLPDMLLLPVLAAVGGATAAATSIRRMMGRRRNQWLDAVVQPEIFTKNVKRPRHHTGKPNPYRKSGN